MSHDVKRIRPSKHSRFKQSYINPLSCKKLFESQKGLPIRCMSSYEKKFIQWLETNRKVIKWGSECIKIPYINQGDGTHHLYYPDFVVEMENGLFLIEIKPYNQTQEPNPNLPKDSYAWKEYIRNISKWEAAKQFCERNGMHFKIITENTISKM